MAIAAILDLAPDVILLDESTVGQDSENLELLGPLLRSYVKSRGAVAVTT